MTQTQTLTPLPPPPGKCQTCAHDHAPEQPHNRHSMYYQISFQQQHGRSPDWADAMAHCSVEVQQRWIEALTAVGQRVKPEGEAGS